MNKFVVFFILILVAGLGLAGFWYWQGNQYSKEILKLEILGPNEVQAGEEVEYLVKFKNNGKVRLEEPELIFEYPENSIPQEGHSQRITQIIEDIYPGEERLVEFKARVFGKEDDILEAKAWLTYQPSNLNASYESKTTLTSQIKFVPLSFEFDLPLKIEQGERIEFSLNYFSNIDYVLNNLRVKIEYPDGFEFLGSQPKALDRTEWDLPSLAQANGGRIEIQGILDGEEGSQKIFKAQLGVIRDAQFIFLKQASQNIEIIEPSLYISQLINGSQNYAANTAELLHYEIFFKNIGRTPIQKKFLFVELEGSLFDLSTLKSDKGEVGRGDKTIIWDWKVIPSLRFLDSEDEGKVDFWINVKEESFGQQIQNQTLKNKITLAGTQKTFTIKVNSQPEIAQKVYYQEEMFGNSGPMPPTVGERTTYTVLWQVKNSWNILENVKVKTRLPNFVSVTGKFFPEDAKFTFDSKSREVVWNVGDVRAWQGFGSSEEDKLPLTLAFQIEYIPDSSQKGTKPLLVKQANLIAEDVFTLETIQAQAQGVNTTLPDDEAVSEQQGIVQ